MTQRSLLLLLAGEEGKQGNALHANHFETDARNISLGLSLLTKASHQHLIVLGQIVEAAVPGDESGYFLAVLLEHDSNALADGGVRLFGLDTDLLDH